MCAPFQVYKFQGFRFTITVSGASPLVDVTNTSTRTELTREQLDILPTSRDGVKAFMGQVPGIRSNLDVGASSLTDGVVYRAYGQLGESWNMLPADSRESRFKILNPGAQSRFLPTFSQIRR